MAKISADISDKLFSIHNYILFLCFVIVCLLGYLVFIALNPIRTSPDVLVVPKNVKEAEDEPILEKPVAVAPVVRKNEYTAPKKGWNTEYGSSSFS